MSKIHVSHSLLLLLFFLIRTDSWSSGDVRESLPEEEEKKGLEKIFLIVATSRSERLRRIAFPFIMTDIMVSGGRESHGRNTHPQ
jgi:hypothetical protein